MRTACNPGRLFSLSGSFDLAMSLEEQDAGEDGDLLRRALVVDRESGAVVVFADLLRAFLADPTDRVTGPIRITIEPSP